MCCAIASELPSLGDGSVRCSEDFERMIAEYDKKNKKGLDRNEFIELMTGVYLPDA